MSFFIRNNRGGGSSKRKFSNTQRNNNQTSSANPDNSNTKQKKKKFRDDESIDSSDEELAEQHQNSQQDDGTDDSEAERETAQEKRLRLAKKYLAEVEAEEKDKAEFEEGAVSRRLHEEYLEEKGKLRKKVADSYTGHGELVDLKCKNHKASITCICISTNSKFLYSGSKDGSVVKWSLLSKTKVHVVEGKRKSKEGIKTVICLALSTDNKFLVVGDGGCKEIIVFSGDNLKHLKTLQGHRGPVTSLTFRKDTHTLYSGSDDKCVKVWNLDDMAYVETLFGHQSAITSIDALSRERAITSGGFDRTIRVWKIVEESQLIFNNTHGNSVDVVKLLNEENFLSCGDDGQLCLWTCNKKRPLCSVPLAHGVDKINGQPMWISSIATLLNSDLVASGSKDGTVRLWKCEHSFKSLTLLFQVNIVGFINSMSFTHDGNNLIVGVGQEHKLGRWWKIPEAKNKVVIIPLLKK